MVVRCGCTIDEDQVGASLMGNQGELVSRLYFEGGADHQEEVAVRAGLVGKIHRLDRHGLTERNRVGFDEAVAFITVRVEVICFKTLLDCRYRPLLAAGETGCRDICTMQFNDLLIAIPSMVLDRISRVPPTRLCPARCPWAARMQCV